ncbi:hypothetical protein GTQ40_06120 [Flavobacteriaceae bacterium R38]|nr:hypothetical protein [Flavobacteriaceae bacterium R38]
MKKLKNVILIAVFLCGSLALAQAEKWVTIEAKEAGYKIDFPTSPVAQSQEIPSELGVLDMKFFMLDNSLDTNADNLVYMSAHTKYPKEFVNDGSKSFTDNILDGVVNGAANNVGGTLLSDKKILFKESPGRAVKIQIPGGIIVNMRIVLIENSLYVYQTICNEAKDDNAKMIKFFDSFDLISTTK